MMNVPAEITRLEIMTDLLLGLTAASSLPGRRSLCADDLSELADFPQHLQRACLDLRQATFPKIAPLIGIRSGYRATADGLYSGRIAGQGARCERVKRGGGDDDDERCEYDLQI